MPCLDNGKHVFKINQFADNRKGNNTITSKPRLAHQSVHRNACFKMINTVQSC